MLVVFDLDGTLIDSRRDLADAANALIAERGGKTLDVEAITRMVGEGAALLVRRALIAAGLDPELPTGLSRFLELYDERLLVHTRPYDGIPEALQTLASEHQLAVLTNKPTRPSRDILNGLGLLQYFRDVVGGDNPRGRKPDPNALLAMVGGAAPSDVILVGDSRIDMATARAADVRFCVARYGFGFHAEEMRIQPDDLVVDRPEDLAIRLRQELDTTRTQRQQDP